MKQELHKKIGFVAFVMAVFLAGFSLTVMSEYPWMICVAGVVLLASSVYLALHWEKGGSSVTEKTTELLLVDRIVELMRANEKAEKGVYIAVKKQQEAMESGMEALREQLAEVVKAQENAVKTVVMYNKENAKQIAMSQREEIRRLCDVVEQLQTGGGETGSDAFVTEAVREMSGRLYEELHENGEAMLSELESTADSLEEMKEMLKQLCENRLLADDILNQMQAVEETEDLPEEAFVPTELPEPEEFSDVIEIPEPELSEELISFYEMTEGNPELPGASEEASETEAVAEEISEEETTEEETPEDAMASSGVDLSDPNKPLSADDIAALFAAMGN